MIKRFFILRAVVGLYLIGGWLWYDVGITSFRRRVIMVIRRPMVGRLPLLLVVVLARAVH